MLWYQYAGLGKTGWKAGSWWSWYHHLATLKISERRLKLSSLNNHLKSLCKYFQPTVALLIPMFQNIYTAERYVSAGDTICQLIRQACDEEIRTVTWLQLWIVIPGRQHGLGPHALSEKEESNIFLNDCIFKIQSWKGAMQFPNFKKTRELLSYSWGVKSQPKWSQWPNSHWHSRIQDFALKW